MAQGVVRAATRLRPTRLGQFVSRFLHATDDFFGRSPRNPTFDIHYSAREAGGKSMSSQEVPYVLIVSVRAPSVRDLYDRIYRRYRTILEVLTPVIQIRVRT